MTDDLREHGGLGCVQCPLPQKIYELQGDVARLERDVANVTGELHRTLVRLDLLVDHLTLLTVRLESALVPEKP
jgi:hypothetical protein